MASLPEVFRVLSDEAVKREVLDNAWLATIGRTEREQYMESAFIRWRSVRKGDRRKRLQRLRDHTLAHNLIRKTLQDGLEAPLTDAELVVYGEEVLLVVDELARACLGVSGRERIRLEAQRAATRIWRKIAIPDPPGC